MFEAPEFFDKDYWSIKQQKGKIRHSKEPSKKVAVEKDRQRVQKKKGKAKSGGRFVVDQNEIEDQLIDCSWYRIHAAKEAFQER